MDLMHTAPPRCGFYERTPVEGGWRYELINIAVRSEAGRLPTNHPPAVGDLVHLWDARWKRGGSYRVVERAWSYPAYGSTDWPSGTPTAKEGPLLDVIVEAAEGGPFRDEVSSEEE